MYHSLISNLMLWLRRLNKYPFFSFLQNSSNFCVFIVYCDCGPVNKHITRVNNSILCELPCDEKLNYRPCIQTLMGLSRNIPQDGVALHTSLCTPRFFLSGGYFPSSISHYHPSISSPPHTQHRSASVSTKPWYMYVVIVCVPWKALMFMFDKSVSSHMSDNSALTCFVAICCPLCL